MFIGGEGLLILKGLSSKKAATVLRKRVLNTFEIKYNPTKPFFPPKRGM